MPRRPAVMPTIALVAAVAVAGLPGDSAAQPGSDATSGAHRLAQAETTETIETIETKREDARRLVTEIEELGARASAVVEEYRLAEEQLGRADADLFATRRRVEELRREHEEAQRAAEARVVRIYQGGGAPTPLSFVDAGSVQELGLRRKYAATIARRDRADLQRLDDASDRLADEEERSRRQRDELAERERDLRTKRDEVAAATSEREAALAAAQGEIAELVEAERQRRQAEEERRAREELARRRAAAEEEARRRAAATTTTVAAPTAAPGTSSGGEAATTTTTTGATNPPPARSGSAPPVHPNAQVAVQTALDQIGKPYQWGGNGPDSFDCSGLTSFAWRAAGVTLPRSSRLQKAALPPVGIDEVQPGDLLFYGDPVHHVGLYVGDGEMVNAPFTGATVRLDSIFRRDFNGAGRPG